jgi:hypothetical protein
MNDQKNLVDFSLKQKNAKSKGYKYIGDIVYNAQNKNNIPKEISELINIHGYKLGSPSQTNENSTYCGLYMPINIL